MKILFFIRSLELGGAERQLLNLASALSRNNEVVVLTFYDRAEYQLPAEVLDRCQILSLEKTGRWHFFGFLMQFLQNVHRIKPDLIYAFMNTASVVSVLARLVSRRIRIVWGVRSSNMRLSLYGKLPQLFRHLECKLSRFADLIIANSQAGRTEAIRDGFKNQRILVIPNGIDTEEFRNSAAFRQRSRAALNIPDNATVIGTVARHDPMKGLEIFLEAAAMHKKRFPDTYYLLIGSGAKGYTGMLHDRAIKLELHDRLKWLGMTNCVAPYYSAMDIFTSASIYGEGFSNAIGEAMASELACVVTDVGDSRILVGNCGIVVSPGSAEELVAAWTSLESLGESEREKMGAWSRDRILQRFSIPVMAASTESALKAIVRPGLAN